MVLQFIFKISEQTCLEALSKLPYSLTMTLTTMDKVDLNCATTLTIASVGPSPNEKFLDDTHSISQQIWLLHGLGRPQTEKYSTPFFIRHDLTRSVCFWSLVGCWVGCSLGRSDCQSIGRSDCVCFIIPFQIFVTKIDWPLQKGCFG